MAGFVVQQGATVLCSHSGQAQPATVNPRVSLGGAATVVMSATYLVTGCGLQPTGNPFCASAQWVSAATRVTSAGQALLLADSQATCTPTGQPLLIASTQVRVSAQ